MTYFAVHDAAGNISYIFGCPRGGPLARPDGLEPGQSISEVELPEGAVDSRDPGSLANLLDVAKKFRVEIPAVRPASLRSVDRGQ
jgi:hypothetical protein